MPDTCTLNRSSGNSDSQGRELMGQAVVSIPHCSSESNAVLSSPLVLYSSPNYCPLTKAEALLITGFPLILVHEEASSLHLFMNPVNHIPSMCSSPCSLLSSLVTCWHGFGLSYHTSSPSLASPGPRMPQAPSIALHCLMDPGHRVLTIITFSLGFL